MSKSKNNPPGNPGPSNKSYNNHLGEPQLVVSASLVPEYESLLTDWQNCERCPLHASRENVVFAKGELPAEVLFIGDAPGPSEDRSGFPLMSTSGRLFNFIIKELQNSRKGWTYGAIYPLGCTPWSDDSIVRPAERKELKACNPRTLGLIKLANPLGIVLLGKEAESFWVDYGPAINKEVGRIIPVTSVATPARIMFTGGATESNMTYRTVLSALKGFLFQRLKVGK